MSDDDDDLLKKYKEYAAYLRKIDPENPSEVANWGADEAALAMTEMLVELRSGRQPAGIIATKIARAVETFRDQPGLLNNWLEGYCDLLQRALEAGMEGGDIGEAIKGDLRLSAGLKLRNAWYNLKRSLTR